MVTINGTHYYIPYTGTCIYTVQCTGCDHYREVVLIKAGHVILYHDYDYCYNLVALKLSTDIHPINNIVLNTVQ